MIKQNFSSWGPWRQDIQIPGALGTGSAVSSAELHALSLSTTKTGNPLPKLVMKRECVPLCEILAAPLHRRAAQELPRCHNTKVLERCASPAFPPSGDLLPARSRDRCCSSSPSHLLWVHFLSLWSSQQHHISCEIYFAASLRGFSFPPAFILLLSYSLPWHGAQLCNEASWLY